jgi:hypothetical protein
LVIGPQQFRDLLGLVTQGSRTEAAPLVYRHRVYGTHSGFMSPPRAPMRAR